MDEVLFNKLQRLKEEAKYLVDNKPEFLRILRSSTETKKIVERCVYLCAEIILDIADLLIIQKGYPKPSSYSDSIYKLGDYGISINISEDDAVFIDSIYRGRYPAEAGLLPLGEPSISDAKEECMETVPI